MRKLTDRLNELPGSDSTDLVVKDEAEKDSRAEPKPPAKRKSTKLKRKPSRSRRKITVVKESPLAALLKPIGVSLALLLIAYGALSVGVTFWRSYQRHMEFNTAVHGDSSVLDIFFPDPSIPADAVNLVYKDVDGTVHKLLASKSATDEFVNETLVMLDKEREAIKQAAHEDIDRSFDVAFSDREQAIDGYADWFFAWKRSYVVLMETISSAINNFFEAGQYESLDEAIEADVEEYFLENYKEQVLKPELRDGTLAQGVEQAVRHAHESYVRVIANGDMRLQLFLAQNTRQLEEIPASEPVTDLKLDWDAQRWKAPTYLMQDKAFEGVVGMGAMAAGGTVGALALGPALSRTIGQSFSALSSRLAASLGSRIAFAEGGAVAGTFVQPMGGQVIGAAIGLAIGAVADYLTSEANEAINRDAFIEANNTALDATIDAWKARLKANVDAAIDKWFDDARKSVVLSTS
ncbi:hypothetical protein V6C03_14735 [Methyloligella sp. 2.7D]|uniref:hypothetical protein n=1 Tax=unclassified Methyloligella TaxID=2625955 RepID=UPI00157D6910|nr:hypothetical protein [Methyloligella sp. GL2]QKP76997.1 hypothetical protein HT051_05730 [Methyloligella sp. GL2]